MPPAFILSQDQTLNKNFINQFNLKLLKLTFLLSFQRSFSFTLLSSVIWVYQKLFALSTLFWHFFKLFFFFLILSFSRKKARFLIIFWKIALSKSTRIILHYLECKIKYYFSFFWKTFSSIFVAFLQHVLHSTTPRQRPGIRTLGARTARTRFASTNRWWHAWNRS